LNIDIKLYYNNAFKWYVKDNIYVIGYAIYKDKILENDELVDYFSFNNESELKKKLEEINGYFSVVIKYKDKCYIISDIIRSFPIFYSLTKKGVFISDNIHEFENSVLLDDSVCELRSTGYVTGDKTLYENIFQIENSQIVKFDNDGISKSKYFKYKYNVDNCYDSFLKIDSAFNAATKRMIKYLNGRTAVVPLSGGHDSRIIAYYLKSNGYENIICYTYGKEENSEALVSKGVADYLGIPWYFVKYDPKSMRKKYRKQYNEVADYYGRGYSLPLIQEWEAIDYLFKNGIVTDNDVVLPGYTGDFITGNHLVSEEVLRNNSLVDLIYSKNYCLFKGDNGESNKRIIEQFVVNNGFDTNKIDDCINATEMFDFEERQTKFISNAVRNYDYHGLKWYMFFWDKEIIDLWLTFPYESKLNRNLFVEFVNQKYGDLMNKIPVVKVNKMTNKKFISRLNNMFNAYFNHFINYYMYLSYFKYLYYVLKNKSTNYYYMFACEYLSYLEKRWW